MTCLSAVVEAVGAFAGFAAEGEEIELVAVGVLTVGTDRFDVFIHGGEGLRLGRCWRSGRRRHDGRLDECICLLGWSLLPCRQRGFVSSLPWEGGCFDNGFQKLRERYPSSRAEILANT